MIKGALILVTITSGFVEVAALNSTVRKTRNDNTISAGATIDISEPLVNQLIVSDDSNRIDPQKVCSISGVYGFVVHPLDSSNPVGGEVETLHTDRDIIGVPRPLTYLCDCFSLQKSFGRFLVARLEARGARLTNKASGNGTVPIASDNMR